MSLILNSLISIFCTHLTKYHGRNVSVSVLASIEHSCAGHGHFSQSRRRWPGDVIAAKLPLKSITLRSLSPLQSREKPGPHELRLQKQNAKCRRRSRAVKQPSAITCFRVARDKLRKGCMNMNLLDTQWWHRQLEFNNCKLHIHARLTFPLLLQIELPKPTAWILLPLFNALSRENEKQRARSINKEGTLHQRGSLYRWAMKWSVTFCKKNILSGNLNSPEKKNQHEQCTSTRKKETAMLQRQMITNQHEPFRSNWHTHSIPIQLRGEPVWFLKNKFIQISHFCACCSLSAPGMLCEIEFNQSTKNHRRHLSMKRCNWNCTFYGCANRYIWILQ